MTLLEIIKKRRSIRRYTSDQISRESLEQIIEAGIHAPNAGGGQRSLVVGLQNKELVRKLGHWNAACLNRGNLAGSHVSAEQPSIIDDPSIMDGFYGAPTVIAIFNQRNFLFKTADAFCMAENMVLMATELGLASCIISRGEETFKTIEAKELLSSWEVPEDFICTCFVILGHLSGDYPSPKPRKQGRVKIID